MQAGSETLVVWETVDRLRRAAGLSKKALAAAAGVSETAVQKWRNGGAIRIDTLRKLSVILNATLDELAGSPAVAPAPDERLAAILAEMDDGQLRGTLASAIDHCNATAIEIVAGELAARARRGKHKEGEPT